MFLILIRLTFLAVTIIVVANTQVSLKHHQTEESLLSTLQPLIEEMCKFNCNSGLHILSSNSTQDIFTAPKLSHFSIVLEDFSTITALGQHSRRVFTIVFIKQFEDFKTFYSRVNVRNFHLNGFFLLVYPNGNGKLNEMRDIFTLLWKIFIYNVDVVVRNYNEEKLEVFTFMPFDGKCDNTMPVKINEYNGSKWLHQHAHFFPRKFLNLNKCAIRCGFFNLEPAIIVEQFDNGTQHYSGFDVDIFTEIMTSINAKINFKVYPVSTGSIFVNNTASGLLGRMVSGEVDVTLRSWSNQPARRELLTDSVSYYSDTLIMLMPMPLPLSPLAKFFRPLSIEVWISLLLVLVLAAIVIGLFKLIPQPYYFYIVGDELRNEFLNILIGFVGLSQPALPERNFPRFLLMMFLIFCLIVRSLYLGEMFNMLKQELRSREFTSIADFSNAGFSFYIYETLAERLDYEEINKRRIIIKLDQVEHYSLMTLDDNFKGVVFQYITAALYRNQRNFKNFTLKICTEPLMTNHLIFYFRKDFYLIDEVNERIGIMKSSGIVEYFISKYADKKFKQVSSDSTGPSKLELHHFIGVYQMWSFGLALSFLTFLVELTIARLTKRRRKLKERAKRVHKKFMQQIN